MKNIIVVSCLFLMLCFMPGCTAEGKTGEIAKAGLAAADGYLDADITLQEAYEQIGLCLTEAKACAKESSTEDALIIASLAGLKEYFSCVEKGVNCYNTFEITKARNQLARTLGEELREEYVKSK